MGFILCLCVSVFFFYYCRYLRLNLMLNVNLEGMVLNYKKNWVLILVLLELF